MRCILCGRLTTPAVLLGEGELPVGPKCARRAGLLQRARRGTGARVRLYQGARVPRGDNRTLDLFAEGPCAFPT